MTSSGLHRAYIGMGSNLGDRAMTLVDAFAALDRIPETRLAARSSIYVTEPIDPTGLQQDYYNAVAAVDTPFAPQRLLEALQRIEAGAARIRDPSSRNMARTLDLDILLYDQLELDEPGLQVPHPRIAERAFVLVPLAEIAPGCQIPGHGAISGLMKRVSGQRVVRLAASLTRAS